MIPRSYAQKAIRPEMTVRQVAADFPAAQEVFRRYGERDAPPARFGHLEPLTHFASRRGVPLETLLSELAAATGVPVRRSGRFAEGVHHGFVLWALVITLTLGAGWGVWLLGQISLQGDFQAAPAAFLVGHGEAQLWGFLVLFILGISLRTVLQGAVRMPHGKWIARGLLALALAGIGGSLLWTLFPERLAWLGVASGTALCLMAAGILGLQLALLRARWRDTWARAVLASGVWLAVWAGTTLWLRWSAGGAGPAAYSMADRLLLIELAVFGFAMNTIYGFGQMLLPGFLRIGKVRDRAIEEAHWAHNSGGVLVCSATALGAGGLLTGLGSALLVTGAVLFAVGHRGFIGRCRTSHRAEQGHAPLDLYPPLAFFWLMASLVLMTAGILIESATGRPLDHAYMGAVRHALTVGFMTTLILGVGQRLVPVLDRTVLALPRLAVPIFVLIGAGNLLRVGSELAILATPAGFRVMPVSGLLEWTALLLFAISITATMFHRGPLNRQGRVTPQSSLAALLGDYPWIEDRLRPAGTRYLERTRSVPPELTIGSFAQSEGYAASELVSQINAWLADGPPDRRPLASPPPAIECRSPFPAGQPRPQEQHLRVR